MRLTSQLDLNLLNVFLEVFRLGSITLAAESLDMTQPGISGALKRLQQQLGAQLFVREGRGISPTHVAVQLAEQLEPALGDVSSALASIRQFDPSQVRNFKLMVGEMTLLLLQEKVAQDPHLDGVSFSFTMLPDDEEAMLQALSLQQVDLAIDVYQPKLYSYNRELIHRDELVVLADKHHPRIQQQINIEQFFAEQHVILKLRRHNATALGFLTDLNLQQRKLHAECFSLLSMMALLEGSELVGVTMRSIALRYAERFNLQLLPFPAAARPIEQGMLWHSRNQHSSAHQWLRKKISSYMNENH